jgi:hypothetical protein
MATATGLSAMQDAAEQTADDTSEPANGLARSLRRVCQYDRHQSDECCRRFRRFAERAAEHRVVSPANPRGVSALAMREPKRSPGAAMIRNARAPGPMAVPSCMARTVANWWGEIARRASATSPLRQVRAVARVGGDRACASLSRRRMCQGERTREQRRPSSLTGNPNGTERKRTADQ